MILMIEIGIPGLKKSLKEYPPGSTAIVVGVIEIGVATAIVPAIRRVIRIAFRFIPMEVAIARATGVNIIIVAEFDIILVIGTITA